MSLCHRMWLCLPILVMSLVLSPHSLARDDGFGDMEGVSEEELQRQDIPVDERIFLTTWNTVPYDPEFFTYSHEQVKERWDYLMRGLLVPYFSADLLRTLSARYPVLVNEIDGFDGNFDDLERRLNRTWALFFAGHFQQAREEGLALGPFGKVPALFSQLMYALYLTDRQSVKNMLLQDVANVAQDYLNELSDAEGDDDMTIFLSTIRLGYAYAIARIAEESPVPVIIARNYINIVKDNAEHILGDIPDHPLGLAFLAGVDANIMRRVGRFTGRMTYGARSTTVDDAFSRALELAGDIPIVHYELANALVYMSRRRDLNDANFHLETAMRIRPQFSMDALDVMYAYRRLQEVRLFALNFRSFRDFERSRRLFSHITDRNLTSVLLPPLTMDMLENPENYILQD